MADTLVQSFGKLKVVSSSSSGPSGDLGIAPSTAGVKPAARSKDTCASYPPLPRTFVDDPHTWMLSWKLNSAKVFPQSGATDAEIIIVLREIAHFPHIWPMRALLDDAPWPGPDDHHWSLPTQVIVCISFTKKRWFHRRPTAEHYARLTKILGDPTWFRDFLPKDQWHDHCLEVY